jgi:hypothetical protein
MSRTLASLNLLTLDNLIRSTWYESNLPTSHQELVRMDRSSSNAGDSAANSSRYLRFALSAALLCSARCKSKLTRRIYKRGVRVLVMSTEILQGSNMRFVGNIKRNSKATIVAYPVTVEKD